MKHHPPFRPWGAATREIQNRLLTIPRSNTDPGTTACHQATPRGPTEFKENVIHSEVVLKSTFREIDRHMLRTQARFNHITNIP